MTMRRSDALALIGASLMLSSCGRHGPAPVRVGSKNFTEDITVAEIYAAALERAHIPVERHMDIGSTQIAIEAMQRGDIDLYPEYTGTGLIDVLHLPPMRDGQSLFDTVKRGFEERYDLTWLTPSPANDSQGLATTRAVSQKFNLRTLSGCAQAAPQLRFASIPEFVARADALPGLQKFYGGFKFADIRIYAIGLQYAALERGEGDVAAAFTTDSQIASDDLVLLEDDRHFWPPYNIAPVVRTQVLRARPQIAGILAKISPLLTDAAVRRLNLQVNVQKMDPADAAAQFLRSV